MTTCVSECRKQTGRLARPRVPAMLLIAFVAFLGTGIAGVSPASAQDAQTPHAVARVVSERSALVAGETNHVGVTITMDPGWYVYWSDEQNGLPTTLRVQAPEGVEVGRAVFPAPARHTMPGGILDYIYRDEVTVILPVRVEPSMVGQSVTLAINAEWLVCNDVCLPGGQAMSETFRVVSTSAETRPTADAKHFARTRARLPRPLEQARGVLEFEWRDGMLEIEAPRGGTLRFFPYADGAEIEDLLGTGESKSGRLALTPGETDRPIAGIVELRPALGGAARLFEVTAPIGVDPMTLPARLSTRDTMTETEAPSDAP